MTPIGTVIQPGEQIADDVTGVRSDDGRTLPILPGDYAVQRLTVTAVREQPAEPERSIGPCPVCGSVAPHGPHEQPAEPALLANLPDMQCPDEGTHIAHGWWALNGQPHFCQGFVGRAGVPADPEPQQAASPLLDLVRQYGDVRWETGTLLDGGARDAFMASRGLAETLFARIAALVPQQPVQAGDLSGGLWWLHQCGEPEAVLGGPPNPEIDCRLCKEPGPWRPLLVAAPNGDRAPERRLVPGPHTDAPCTDACYEPHVNGPREPTWQEVGDHFLMQALGVERLDEVMPAIERLRDNNCTSFSTLLVPLGAENLTQALAEVERLKAQLNASIGRCNCAVCHEVPAAQPDRPVLRLSNEPEAAVALIGVKSGRRYEPSRTGSGAWRDMTTGQTMPYIRVMEREREVRVELAPPPEHRTWPKLDDEPDVLPQVVDVAGNGRWRLMNGRIYRQGSLADNTIRDASLAELRQLGDVTEVLDRKPPP